MHNLLAAMVRLIWLGAIFAISGCTHTRPLVDYGVQKDHLSFVPARIAVVNCKPWPNGARFLDLPLTNVETQEQARLCEEFDHFVLEGFSDQPYMRGLSPKAIAQLLAQNNNTDILNRVETLWQHQGDDCADCKNPAAFYVYSIAGRQDWQAWLAGFSRATRNSDAILMPFVTYARASQTDERGLLAARKRAGVALLLIDTNNGNLIWAGGRQAEAIRRELRSQDVDKQLLPPPWTEVYSRLLTEDIFKDFPGRQQL